MSVRALRMAAVTALLALSGCSPAPAPSASVASAPADSSAAPAASSADAGGCPNPEGGDANECLGVVSGGTYATASFEPPIGYTVTDGWGNYEDLPGNFLLVPPGASLEGVNADTGDFIGIYSGVAAAAASCEEAPEPQAEISAEGMAAWFTSNAAVDATAQPARVLGLDGVMVDMRLDSAWTGTCPFAHDGEPLVPILVGTGPAGLHHVLNGTFAMRLYLADFSGRVIGIEVVDHPGGQRMDDYDAIVRAVRLQKYAVGSEPWILFDAAASDPDEDEPHDAIFLVRPDGTGLHRLVHQMYGSELRATWSPDGYRVAYIQTTLDHGPEGGVYIANVDGTGAHRIFECADWCVSTDYLDWASDNQIYVGIDSDAPDPDEPPHKFEVWRIDPDSGEGEPVLTREDGMTVEQPRVSADATRLAYVRVRLSDDAWAIFASDMRGGEEVQLTDWDLSASYPDWSPTDTISFNTNDLRLRHDGKHELYTVAADGAGLRALNVHDPSDPAITAEAGHARWTADGTGLTFSLFDAGIPYLALMDADGDNQRLVPGPIEGTFSELRPVGAP